MSLSDSIAIIQTILAFGAFIFTYSEFNRWRKELIGSKRIDLVIRLGKSAIDVREAFNSARAISSDGNIDLQTEYNRRVKGIREKLLPLYEIRWEIEILFGKSIQEEMKQYNAKYHELENAMREILDHKNDNSQIIYQSKEDKFGAEIEAITEKLLNFARKYIK